MKKKMGWPLFFASRVAGFGLLMYTFYTYPRTAPLVIFLTALVVWNCALTANKKVSEDVEQEFKKDDLN